jgi:hypothetical protein
MLEPGLLEHPGDDLRETGRGHADPVSRTEFSLDTRSAGIHFFHVV